MPSQISSPTTWRSISIKYASLLIAQGVDVRTVASLLGHAQASTTLDIYAHAFDKNKRKAQEKLGKAIGL
ncbi:MAG: tyrosine-type recombinase/integrase [Subdoligranulum sp.]|nr:tyrosine-type recombinase/integrase [Subdoligranulum sp.]